MLILYFWLQLIWNGTVHSKFFSKRNQRIMVLVFILDMAPRLYSFYISRKLRDPNIRNWISTILMIAILTEIGIYFQYIYFAAYESEYKEELSTSVIENSSLPQLMKSSKSLLKTSLTMDSENPKFN